MNSPYSGKPLSTKQFKISEWLLEDHYQGLDLQPSSTGLLPSTISSEVDNGYFGEIAYPYQKGHLWLRQQLYLHQPMHEDITYQVSGSIEEIYTKRNRRVVHYGIDFFSENEELSVGSHHHQSFLSKKIEDERVQLRAPASKPGTRTFQVPEGKRFGGLVRTISREMCGVYFHGDANYHTNQQSAQQLGFEDVVVGGRMTLAYVAHVLEEYFGTAWWYSGALDLKFTNPVWCADKLQINGVFTGSDPVRENALHCFVWIEKANGSIAVVAEASVLA